MDDIVEAAWARRKMKQHVDIYGNYKMFIPEDTQFDAENRERMENPDYNGFIFYAGNRPIQQQAPPQMPPALVQWMNFIDAQFNRNTGITSTQQGFGESNKVATAFRQEERFADERRDEIRFKVYEAYARAMLIATYLVQRYNMHPIEVRRGGKVKFHFNRDVVRGVINYRIDVIDEQVGDPMQDRLVEIQTVERVLSNPILMQEFDVRELARIIARVNRWGNRVLARQEIGGGPGLAAEGGPGGGAQPGATAGGSPGGRRSLGSRVDSAQEQGNTESAVAGASLRRLGG